MPRDPGDPGPEPPADLGEVAPDPGDLGRRPRGGGLAPRGGRGGGGGGGGLPGRGREEVGDAPELAGQGLG